MSQKELQSGTDQVNVTSGGFSTPLLKGVQYVYGFSESGDINHAVLDLGMNPNFTDSRTDAWHGFPIVRFESLLQPPELEAHNTPGVGGEPPDIGAARAQPEQRFIEHSSIYNILYNKSSMRVESPNMRVDLTFRPVTRLAKAARHAPGGHAGHPCRYNDSMNERSIRVGSPFLGS